MRKNHELTDAEQTDAEVLGRRTLLRRAGTIAALAGGAAVVQAAGTSSAQAASGGNLVLGSANSADAAATSLTSSVATGTTLALTNSGTAHAPLSLTKSADGIFAAATPVEGEIFAGGTNTDLWYVDGTSKPHAALVFTETTANQVIGITPVRMLDTRTAGGRTNVIDTTVLNTAGQLVGKKWLQLDMTALALFFESAFINLTVVAPAATGFLTVAPAPTAAGVQPSTSNLNYRAGVTLANAGVAPTADGSVWIYASSTVHILLDVTALNLPSTDFLLTAPAAAAITSSAKLKAAFSARRMNRLARG